MTFAEWVKLAAFYTYIISFLGASVFAGVLIFLDLCKIGKVDIPKPRMKNVLLLMLSIVLPIVNTVLLVSIIGTELIYPIYERMQWKKNR